MLHLFKKKKTSILLIILSLSSTSKFIFFLFLSQGENISRRCGNYLFMFYYGIDKLDEVSGAIECSQLTGVCGIDGKTKYQGAALDRMTAFKVWTVWEVSPPQLSDHTRQKTTAKLAAETI